MEGAREVNGALEASTGAPHIRRKENGSSPPANNPHMIESSGLFIPEESEWHENVSLRRSPELVREAVKGKDLLRNTGLQVWSGSLQGSSDRGNEAHEMVEELTLKNYRFPHLAQPSSSHDGEEQVDKGLWHSFYKLAGDPRETAMQEPETTGSRAGVENSSFSHFWNPRLLAQDHSGLDGPCAPDHTTKGENTGDFVNANSRSFTGIRTKILSSSGFPQVLVKNNLKGKGAAYRYTRTIGVTGAQRQGHSTADKSGGSVKETTPGLMPKSGVRANGVPPLYGGGLVDVNPSKQEEIGLRSWLRHSDHRTSKSEKLDVFRQVLELVELSHSKGLALQHLCPSYFLLLPSNQVKYAGSFVSPKQLDVDEISSGQNIENTTKRKRSYDLNKETHDFPSTKQIKADQFQVANGTINRYEVVDGVNKDVSGMLLFKDLNAQPNFREDMDRFIVYGYGATFPGTVCKRPIPEIMQLEEKWYASPEELHGSTCTFESNIYALGVLFFEIFCFFDSWEVRAAAMSDLRHRILPSIFLSESPKEAGFCLWLLHPEPSSRPKARDVLLSDLLRDSERHMLADQSLSYLEEEDAEADLLFHFLLSLKEEKEKQADKLVKNIDCLRRDLGEIDKRHALRIAGLQTGRNSETSASHNSDKLLYKQPLQLAAISKSSTPSVNEVRLMKNIEQLEHAYFSMRSEVEIRESNATERTDRDVLRNRDRLSMQQTNECEPSSSENADPLGAFFDGLCKYARYNKFEVRGTLRNGDILNSANVICSLSFDRDEEYFAAAGVSKKIKIFEYESLLNDAVDIHYPAIEMSSRSRLSCVCWNGYIKNYLASTDYEGVVQLWDANTGQGFTQYTEHQKRAWSVDFSHVDPTKLASGSDDYSVKLWKINERDSTSTIRSVANVCCVQFSAHSTNLLAFGSADYRIYCYDLRNVRVPWCTLVGHKKAVSYVRFVDSERLVSASTDNTLKLWDLNKTNSSGFSTNACSLTFSGHTNEKNFIGLSVSDGYIACGSETNEVFSYYKSLPMPITSHKFGSIDPISGQETGDDNGQFVSSVCWRGRSNMVVAANSSGSIKLLQMV